MPICNYCGLEKDEEEFNWRSKSLGIRHPTCKECQKPFRKNWYEGNAKERHLQQVKERKQIVREMAKEYIYQYLSTHPCVECGEKDPVVLEFHHTRDKVMDIAAIGGAGYSLESIQAEINKCIVLCGNCHKRLSAKERGWFRRIFCATAYAARCRFDSCQT